MYYEALSLPVEPAAVRKVMSRLKAKRERQELRYLRQRAIEMRRRLNEEQRRREELAAEIERLKLIIVPDVAKLAVIDRTKFSVKNIVSVVARAYGISVDALLGQYRARSHTRARFHVVYLLTTYRPDMSSNEVGRRLNRDHSTILHARAQWPKVAESCVWQIQEVNKELGLSTNAVDIVNNAENAAS